MFQLEAGLAHPMKNIVWATKEPKVGGVYLHALYDIAILEQKLNQQNYQ